jgi:hypothetical protein
MTPFAVPFLGATALRMFVTLVAAAEFTVRKIAESKKGVVLAVGAFVAAIGAILKAFT